MLDDFSTDTGAPLATLSENHAYARTETQAESVLDLRRPQFSVEESEKALAQLAQKAGPASEAIARRVDQSFVPVRGELNEHAGGQASARVMLLAHHAYRAELALELATSTSLVFHGRFAEQGHDKGQTDKALRNVVGIAAFATDLLTKAYEAAKAEGKAAREKPGGPVGELMARIGATPGGGQEVPEASPFCMPAPSSVGAPSPKTPSSSRKKPPSPPEPGGSK